MAPDLFAGAPAAIEILQLPDATLRFQHDFYAPDFCRQALAELTNQTAWRHEQIVLFGKKHWQPRLVAAHGDPGTAYRYSGLTLPMHDWTPLLSQIRQAVEQAAGRSFNSVLLNFYRDEQDSMGWHSDDEAELGPAPVIASVSFGATRVFRLKHKTRRELPTVNLDLTDGSLLLMEGTTQQFWKHAVEKSRVAAGARINLTFRQLVRCAPSNQRQRTEDCCRPVL
jgi:alkylated DNA repair dioxygenase AlkB